MRDAAGVVIYIGKAKSLRKRLASHFAASAPSRRRAQLLATVSDIEVILVNNETEALILEHNLIKQHRPRGNRMLKDEDEGYFYIALTAEDLPRLAPYRKNRVNKELQRGGTITSVARCFGPYVNRRFRDALLKFVSDHFRLRTCEPLATEVCLRYHLGACGGICEGRVSPARYSEAVAEAVRFLAQRHTDLLRHMRRQMSEYAAQLQFERAAHMKQHLGALERAFEAQVVERDVAYDQDVLYFGEQQVLIMQVRRGLVNAFTLDQVIETSADLFLRARYGSSSPRQLIVNQVGSREELEQALGAATGQHVRVTIPRRGQAANALLKLCAMNYAYRTAHQEGRTRGPDSSTVSESPR